MNSYSNITLRGPTLEAVARWINAQGQATYVAQGGGAVIVFHAELSEQESIAAGLSREFDCPALLVMSFGGQVLLYQLYEAGALTDEYVSEANEELGITNPPPGDAQRLCDAFARGSAHRRVQTLLAKLATEGNGYIMAQNRHGELLEALKLPTWAAGMGFGLLEIGEMPADESGRGFEGSLIRTGK